MILYQDFYPRPPRGGRRDAVAQKRRLSHFYPRPPRGGRRPAFHRQKEVRRFLSTPSARRATFLMPQIIRDRPISIHALREEGDVCRYSPSHSHPYFYPRPPRGGRLSASTSGAAALNFYPRPPRGGRPVDSGRVFGGTHFYPRPPRGGRRLPPSGQRLLQETHFYPRPPRGGRRISMPIWTMKFNFYPRPPRGGRPRRPSKHRSQCRFLSTPSARRATQSACTSCTTA